MESNSSALTFIVLREPRRALKEEVRCAAGNTDAVRERAGEQLSDWLELWRGEGLEEELRPEQTLRPKQKTDDRWDSERRKSRKSSERLRKSPSLEVKSGIHR